MAAKKASARTSSKSSSGEARAKSNAAKPRKTKRAKTKPVKAKPTKAVARSVKGAPRYATRADLGAPIQAFFDKQPSALKPLALALRELVERALPGHESSLKWGMPFYTLGGVMVCAIGGHKAHLNLILSGPPGTFHDSEGLLTGDGKTGRHLKLSRLEQLPVKQVKAWLKAAVAAGKK